MLAFICRIIQKMVRNERVDLGGRTTYRYASHLPKTEI